MVLLGLALLPLWGALAYATFDRELALADRVPVGLHDYLLSAYLALALVVAVKVVGVLLVAAFLVIPGAAARLLGRTFAGMTLLALLFALSATLLGLYASFLLDWPSGASVVLAQALLFGLAFLKTAFSGGNSRFWGILGACGCPRRPSTASAPWWRSALGRRGRCP